MVQSSHRRALCARTAFSVLVLALLLPVSTIALAAAEETDEVHWKNGDLVAPLPNDLVKREQALRDVRQRAASRAAARGTGEAITAIPEPLDLSRRAPGTSAGHIGVGAHPAAPGTFSPPLVNDPRFLRTPPDAARAAPPNRGELMPMDTFGGDFDGIDDTGWTPASPDIAVGPDHVMMVVSDEFAVYDKCGNWLDGGDIKEYFGIVTDALLYDPRVVYDDWNHRWVMAWIAYDGGGTESWVELFASASSDPSDGWRSSRTLSFSTDYFVDNMYLAADPTSLYLTFNEYAFSGYAFYRCKVYVVNSLEFYANPSTASASYFPSLVDADASASFSIRPAQMNSYPGETYLINNKFQGGTVGRVWKVYDTPDAPKATHFDITMNAYAPPPPLQQADGSYLRALDARYMDAVYQYGAVYAARSCNASSTNGDRGMIFIDRIDPVAGVRTHTNQLYTATYNRAFPAIDLDEFENIYCAYAQCAPLGYVSLGFSIVLKNGESPWYDTIANGEAVYTLGGAGTIGNPYRWGSYTGGEVDRVDDRSFWIGGAYASNDPIPSWATKVGVVSAFPTDYLDVSPVDLQTAGAIQGNDINRTFAYTLTNDAGITANWQVTGVPHWLTPTAVSGQIPHGGSQDVTFTVNLYAKYLAIGAHTANLNFENCTGSGTVVRDVTVAIVEANECDAAGIDLAPPGVPGEYAQGPGEYGIFVTVMEDIDVCALGIDVSSIENFELTARIYQASGSTRGPLLAESTQWSIDYIPGGLVSVPFDVTLHACQDYELAFEVASDQGFTAFDENWFDRPYDVGGLVRVRIGSDAGAPYEKTPHMGILGTVACDPTRGHTTDLFPSATADTEHDSDKSVGLFITALENMELCALGFEADLNRDTRVSISLYPAVGETRTPIVLTNGWNYVTESGMRYHEIPLYHTFGYGEEYDISVNFEGSAYWPVIDEIDVALPDTVDGAVVVRRAESGGSVSPLIPHFYLKWKDMGTGGFGFDLAKPEGPAPNSTTGPIDHGAYIKALAGRSVYGVGVMADIPEGSFLFARMYAADEVGANRVGLITEGLITTAGAGMRWHDVPLAVEWLADQNYDISVVCSTPSQFDYWDDSTGLPYDAYGTIRVLDGDLGGWAGSNDLINMRVHACNEVLTAAGEQAPRFSTLFINPAAPNPADGMVTFEFSGDGPEMADLEIYDVLGRRVATVFSRRRLSAGLASAEFDAAALASGVYFVKLKTATKAVSRKFVVTH